MFSACQFKATTHMSNVQKWFTNHSVFSTSLFCVGPTLVSKMEDCGKKGHWKKHIQLYVTHCFTVESNWRKLSLCHQWRVLTNVKGAEKIAEFDIYTVLFKLYIMIFHHLVQTNMNHSRRLDLKMLIQGTKVKLQMTDIHFKNHL